MPGSGSRGQMPDLLAHVVPQQVGEAVGARDLEVAVIGGQPGVDHFDHLDPPLADGEPAGRLLAAVAGVAFDADRVLGAVRTRHPTDHPPLDSLVQHASPCRGGPTSRDRPLAEQYEALLTRSRGLRLVELSTALLRTAAELRAELELRTPDAIQLAAAVHGGCSLLITNDRRLPDLPGLPVRQLSDYLAGQ